MTTIPVRAHRTDASADYLSDFELEPEHDGFSLDVGERICPPPERRGGALRALLIVAALAGGGWWMFAEDSGHLGRLGAAISDIAAQSRTPGGPAISESSGIAGADTDVGPAETAPTVVVSDAPIATASIENGMPADADAPAAADANAGDAPPAPASADEDAVANAPVDIDNIEQESLSAPAAAPERPEPLPPPRVDPADPYQKRAAAAGLHPNLSRVLLTRLSASDYRNARYAINTAIAKSSNTKDFVWPRQRKPEQALFRVHFVQGAAEHCRRYVVTVVKDGWSTTAMPMERCGTRDTANRR